MKKISNLSVKLSWRVERLRVNSFWYELMKEPDSLYVTYDKDSDSMTWMGYPVVLDDSISDIEFDFKTSIGNKVKKGEK